MEQFKKSFYGQKYPIKIQKYSGHQYSRFSVIMPGQGSLNIKDHAIQLKKIIQLKKYIQIVDDFIEDKLDSKTIWYLTDPAKIKKNEFATIQNLFLFSMNVAYFDFLVDHKKPEIITSHSFGEYSALVCAGVLTFEQMLEVVFYRELLSPNIGEFGTLIATQIHLSQVQEIVEHLGIEVANINSPNQVVFAVAKSQIKNTSAYFKQNRIAYRVLEKVGRPYHSSLMKTTAVELKDRITKMNLKISASRYQLISSVTHRFYPCDYQFENNELIDLLTDQLTTTLNFQKIVQTIYDNKIYSFLDLSQTGIYQQFVNDILKNENSKFSNQVLSDMHFIDQNKHLDQLFHLDMEKNPLFRTLSKYISQVTGYELIEIGINDYFQEDLRIDSIKKAEIVFKTLQEVNLTIEESLTLAQLRRVGDVVKYLEQRKENPTQNKYNFQYQQKDFHLFKLGQRLIHHAQIQPGPVRRLNSSQMIFDLAFSRDLLQKRLIDFWNQNLGTKKQLIIDLSQINHQMDYPEYLVHLRNLCGVIQDYFPDSNQQNIHILITCYSVRSDLLDLPYVQFFRSVAIEYGFRFQWIQDVDRFFEFENLIHFYEDELNEHFKLKDSQILTNEFVPYPMNSKDIQSKRIKLNHILAIGGAKGLCFEILQRQKELFTVQLTIVGRTSANDPHLVEQIKSLSKKYTQLEYVQVDCIDLMQIKELRQRFAENPFDFIINAAGVEKSEKLIHKNHDQIQVEFLSKIAITENISNEFKTIPTIHFSSIVGLLGNEGQSIYSFANAWQADLRSRHQNLNSKVIFWPAIDQVGMTKNPGLYQKMKANGVQFLKIEQATEFFENTVKELLFYADTDSVCIAHLKDLALMNFQIMDWNKWSNVWGQLVDPERMIFQHRYSIEESSYLADHRFETMSVIPASLIISQIVTYGAKHLGDQLTIVNFNIHNMLMILPGKETISHTQYYHHFVEQQQIIEHRMFSQLEHFSAQICRQTIAQSDHTRVGIEQSFEPDHRLSVDLNSFYSRECIDFGFKFQVFDQLHFCQQSIKQKTTAVGKVKSTSIYYQGFQLADRIVMVIEAALQTASLYGVVEGKRLGIPLSIKEIKMHQTQFNQAFCIAQIAQTISQNQDEVMIFNVQVVDENQQLILELIELVLSPIRSHPTLPFRWLENQTQHEL